MNWRTVLLALAASASATAGPRLDALEKFNFQKVRCENQFSTDHGIGYALLGWAFAPAANPNSLPNLSFKKLCELNPCLSFCSPENSTRVPKDRLALRSQCRSGDETACKALVRLRPTQVLEKRDLEDLCYLVGEPYCTQSRPDLLAKLAAEPDHLPDAGTGVILRIACDTGNRPACDYFEKFHNLELVRAEAACKKDFSACTVFAKRKYAISGNREDVRRIALDACSRSETYGKCHVYFTDANFDKERLDPDNTAFRESLAADFLKLCRTRKIWDACAAYSDFMSKADVKTSVELRTHGCESAPDPFRAQFCQMLAFHYVYAEKDFNRARPVIEKACKVSARLYPKVKTCYLRTQLKEEIRKTKRKGGR